MWIRPSLFEQFSPKDKVVDEYTFTKFLGYEEAEKQLNDHWSSWVTEHDIKKIASYGLNYLRIPVGYWAFEKKPSEPFVMGGFKYLLKAVGWAKKYGLKVIVDLHGAPGSQNGYDHTGRYGPIKWQTGDNIQRTLNVIKNITLTFNHPEFRNTVTSIGVLNEPAAVIRNQFNEYFKDAYNLIREKNSDILILYDASFFFVSGDGDDSIEFLESLKFKRVVLDTHIYNAFTCDFVSLSIDDQFSVVCSNESNIASTNDYLNWTPEYKNYLKQYASAQMNAYEAG
ncbi:24897_t:CDS:2, partial [Gigaspora margarita]